MRSFEPPLWQTGESSIAEVALDPTTRDDIPQLLLGLQHLYSTPSLRADVFQILDEVLPEEIDRTTGRPGMGVWRILVMGVLRLNLNWDYDRGCSPHFACIERATTSGACSRSANTMTGIGLPFTRPCSGFASRIWI